MSNSYRIRTTPGVDKSIKVLIDQEFEYLEILSLKILKDQIYTRQCSDYGVVIGRISVNNGLGIPNAKLSVFIPLSEEDSTNPIISEIYPYKTVTDQNEDGYRYNLLPYIPSYNGHVPTGTFFERDDVILDQTLIEVYDKYYKYTTTTNDSGDFMIFGVPTGEQTIFVDIDLSDIGEFSLSPKDLIDMGVTTEAMVDGFNFKASTNLNSLPQIVSFSRNIQVEPLWGEPEICNIGITRTDFDITRETNVQITPSAIFMGSVISDVDMSAIKTGCKVNKKMGNQCSLITGPGQIKSIRQTINVDNQGRPLLEEFELENGGQVIDENGAWVVNVPMNLNYVTTNEFGEQVLSDDVNVGVPTKGKYRFKVKYNQPPSLDVSIKRAYFLVPNIREYGWTSYITTPNASDVQRSYAFTTNWDDYGDNMTAFGQQMINDAINCEDKFYEMRYNKVYTVSSHITEYRKGKSKKRFIAIKQITDDKCDSEVVRFPTNDAQYDPNANFTLYSIMMGFLLPFMLIMLIVMHVLAFIACFVLAIIATVFVVIGGIIYLIGLAIGLIPGAGDFADKIKNAGNALIEAGNSLGDLCYSFKMRFCLLTYPDCERCDKNPDVSSEPSTPPSNPTVDSLNETNASLGSAGVLSSFYDAGQYNCNSPYENKTGQILAGLSDTSITNKSQGLINLVTIPPSYLFSSSLTLANRMNLFNTKGKYFNSTISPGGGVNQIKVTFDTNINDPNTTWHLDNVVCLVVDDKNISKFQIGKVLTFNNPTMSNDPNLTGSTLNIYSNNAITGTTIGTPTAFSNINQYNRIVEYASPSNTGNLSVTYTLTAFTEDVLYAKYPMDIEYFQVIQIKKVSNFITDSTNLLPDSLPERFIKNPAYYLTIDDDNCMIPDTLSPVSCYSGYNEQNIIFLVRGVDPNTTKTKCSYDLSKLYGYSSFGNVSSIVEGDFYLNIPIQGKLRNVKHDSPLIISNSYATDAYSGQKLFYDSYQFLPGNQFSAFTSTMTKYYSNLDEASQPLTPTNSTLISPNNGLSVNPLNEMTKEWNSSTILGPSCTGFTPTFNSSVVQNRGYLINEQVEGGSLLYLDATIPLIPVANPTSTSQVYSTIYPTTLTTSFTLGPSGRQMVMRSDRLPSSTTTQSNLTNQYVLFENGSLVVYGFDSGGVLTTFDITNSLYTDGGGQDLSDDGWGNIVGNDILGSFECENMVPLGCYSESDGQITIAPPGDNCYTTLGQPTMEDGCYVFLRTPLLSLPIDLFYMVEWFARNTTMYGVCQNVFGHVFTNNWVNGVLYHFPFKNNTFFDDNNDPYAVYCTDVIYLDQTNNNFFYRSAPYTYTNKFIGREAPDYNEYKGNVVNMMFPTTIMDLGPKQKYLQEVSITNEYDGYILNRLSPTTFNDISDLLTLLVVARLVNTLNFGGVLSYFKRDNDFVDGDYAQLIATNSQFGVYPFEQGYYGGNDIYSYSQIFGLNNVIGVFFKSNLQARDYITPKRNIYSGIGPFSTINCALEDIPVFSQRVPFYMWSIANKPTIFGGQINNWDTNLNFSTELFSHRYQDLDRLLQSSRYFRPNNFNQTDYFKGYIYAVNSSGNIDADVSYWYKPTAPQQSILMGAPFYFYFGLRQGRTAFDKFAESWIDFDDITY